MESDSLDRALAGLFTPQQPVRGSVTGPRQGGVSRVTIRPAKVKGKTVHQFEYLRGSQAVHRNLDAPEARVELRKLLVDFRQAVLHAVDADLHLTSTGGAIRLKRKTATCPPECAPHDRPKSHVIPEGSPNPFLASLGVMNADGRVLTAKRDKFRQINRFLEMVGDVVDHLPADRTIRVVDFGCGKSYLTFALYHFLHDLRGFDVSVMGLDLKKDVIATCSAIARDLAYEGLRFSVGEIVAYEDSGPVDMVVSLHACDTATDDALAKAVEWETRVILSVPCCQHELNRQLRNPVMDPMLKHGTIRERLTELVTDSARAALLELCGYSVQLLEFVATEHTPKNLLIRAVKQAKTPGPSKATEYRDFADFWGIRPALERSLEDRLKRKGLA